jgi:hypothetical protein
MPRLLATALLVALATGCGASRTTQPRRATERAVVATPADESSPAAGPGWTAWTRGSTPGPVIVLALGRVMVGRAGGERARAVGPPGVLSAAGGGDARMLAIQQVRGGRSDLKLYDLASGKLRDPPPGVNTHEWEWRGEIYGRWLLFGRVDFGRSLYRVVLRDLVTGKERVLAAVSGHGAYAEPGQLSGRFAVWASCPDNACSLYRLRIGDRVPTRVAAKIYGRADYAVSVTRRGVVYYAEGGLGCGRQVRIMVASPGREPRTVAALPPGYDLRFTTAVDAGRATRILYDRVRCSTKRSDIYEVVDRRLATPPAVSPPSIGMTTPVR